MIILCRQQLDTMDPRVMLVSIVLPFFATFSNADLFLIVTVNLWQCDLVLLTHEMGNRASSCAATVPHAHFASASYFLFSFPRYLPDTGWDLDSSPRHTLVNQNLKETLSRVIMAFRESGSYVYTAAGSVMMCGSSAYIRPPYVPLSGVPSQFSSDES